MIDEKLAKLDHKGKVLLYVMGTANELKEMGLIHSNTEFTEDGKLAFKRLKDSGFKPTTDEIDAVMYTLMQGGKDDGRGSKEDSIQDPQL